MTPPPKSRSKFPGMPQIAGNQGHKPVGFSFESPSEVLRKERKAAPGALMLPSIKGGNAKNSEPASPMANAGIKVLNVNNEHDKLAALDRYRYLIRSPNINIEKITNYLILCIRGLHYSTMCLKEPSKKFINSRKLNISPPKQRRSLNNLARSKTLYLDLDETIIFQVKDPSVRADFEMPTETGEVVRSNNLELRFLARPNWKVFLEEVSENYEIIIFTASTQFYATLVMKALDPDKKFFNGLLARNHCMMTKNGFFIKDLRMVDNRDLKNVLLLDNYVHSFAFNLENGIPILEWRGEQDDDELVYMAGYLTELSREPDVREANKRRLNLASIPVHTAIS